MVRGVQARDAMHVVAIRRVREKIQAWKLAHGVSHSPFPVHDTTYLQYSGRCFMLVNADVNARQVKRMLLLLSNNHTRQRRVRVQSPLSCRLMSFVLLLRCSAVVTLLLLIKFIVVNARWAAARGRAGLRAPEEDQNTQPTDADITAAERTRLVVQNDLENLPLGLMVIWAAALCVGLSNASCSGLTDHPRPSLVSAHMSLTIIFV